MNEKDKETLVTQIIQKALDFARRHDLPSILVLDAVYPYSSSIQVCEFGMLYQSQKFTDDSKIPFKKKINLETQYITIGLNCYAGTGNSIIIWDCCFYICVDHLPGTETKLAQ